MAVLFDMKSKKMYYSLTVTLCEFIVWSDLWKKCVALFCNDSESLLFDIKSGKNVYHCCLVVTHWKWLYGLIWTETVA